MTCIDCGQDTLGPGVCSDCCRNRIDDYPRLKEIVRQLKLWQTELGNDGRINTIDEILNCEYDRPTSEGVK